jgi:hypothetical protein
MYYFLVIFVDVINFMILKILKKLDLLVLDMEINRILLNCIYVHILEIHYHHLLIPII